jgi:hypothetical protein
MTPFIDDEEYCNICKVEETHLSDMDCLAYENEQKFIKNQKAKVAKMMERNAKIIADKNIKNLADLNEYTLRVRKAGA